MRRCSARARYAMLVVALAAMTAAPFATPRFLEPAPPTPAMQYELRMAEYAKRLQETLGSPDVLPTIPESAATDFSTSGVDPAFETTRPTYRSIAGRERADRHLGLACLMAIKRRGGGSDVVADNRRLLVPGDFCACLAAGTELARGRPAAARGRFARSGRDSRGGCHSRPADARVADGADFRVNTGEGAGGGRIFAAHDPAAVEPGQPIAGAAVGSDLVHELAHIRRHDYLVNLWQILVETVLFYHPAVWWLSQRIRIERENCCDDIAIAVVEDRVEYGRALLAVAELHGPQTAPGRARSGSLLARVRRLFPGATGQQTFDSGNLVVVGLLATTIVAATVWATAVAKETTQAAPTDEAAETTEPDANFIDTVSDRFSAALGKQDLPYVTPEIVTVLRAELHDYLTERVTKPLAGASRIKVLKAVDNHVRRDFSAAKSYDHFRENFDTLKWQLWTAMDRRDLTAAEIKKRESQREWMREYIRGLPNTRPEIPEWSHEGRLLLLESAVFGNPLSPFFYEPMSAEEFEKFKTRFLDGQKGMNGGNLVSAPGHFFQTVVMELAESMQKRWPPGFPVDGGLGASNELDFCFQHRRFPDQRGVWQVGDWSNTVARLSRCDRNSRLATRPV